MNLLKKIAGGKTDEEVRNKFVRFGKGEYERFLISIKKGKNLKIKTSHDLTNTLIGIIVKNVNSESSVKGKIIANYDFEKELPCETTNFSKRGKLYTAEISTTLTPEQLNEIYEKFKFQFLLLNINAENVKLKTGSSLPKPGGKIKEDFCSATLPLETLDEFAFDFDNNFTEAKIRHIFRITEVEVPEQYKNNPEQARLNGIRKGTIKKVIDIDGKIKEKEYALNA